MLEQTWRRQNNSYTLTLKSVLPDHRTFTCIRVFSPRAVCTFTSVKYLRAEDVVSKMISWMSEMQMSPAWETSVSNLNSSVSVSPWDQGRFPVWWLPAADASTWDHRLCLVSCLVCRLRLCYNRSHVRLRRSWTSNHTNPTHQHM